MELRVLINGGKKCWVMRFRLDSGEANEVSRMLKHLGKRVKNRINKNERIKVYVQRDL